MESTIDRPRRRLAAWLFITPVLLVFAGSLVGGALASRSSIEAKAGQVIPAGSDSRDGYLIKIARAGRTGAAGKIKSYFGLGAKSDLCWVTREQAAILSQRYETLEDTVTVPGEGTYDLLIVFNGDRKVILTVLDQERCTLVTGPRRTFYLPFHAHTS
jgi:hypothetical protein